MVEFSLIVLFLIAALLFYQQYNARVSLPAPRPDCYGKSESVLKPEEKALFKALEDGLGVDHYVFPKVMAASVLELKPNPDQPLKQASRQRIAHEYFDFVICRKSDQAMTCALRMEAAGKGLTALHDSNVFLGSVCRHVELPYAVIPTESEYQADRVRAQVDEAIAATKAQIKAKAKAKAEAKARAEAKAKAKMEAKAKAEAKARAEAEARAAQKAAAQKAAAQKPKPPAPEPTPAVSASVAAKPEVKTAPAPKPAAQPEPAAKSEPMPEVKSAPGSQAPAATPAPSPQQPAEAKTKGKDEPPSSASASRGTSGATVDVVSAPARKAVPPRRSRATAAKTGVAAAKAKRTTATQSAAARARGTTRRGPVTKKD